MKNMKKFITLCGFLILGSIACGDADVVKAEAINEQTTDTSGYTITIPSDVDIDKDSGKGSFAVSGKAEAQVDLNVSVSSKNNYKLKNKSQEISYSLDKESFHIDNKQPASSKSFDENFNIALANTNTNYSGNYEDNLVFDITGNKYVYKLDVNSLLDGKVEFAGHDYGSFDVYINGQKVADDVSNFDKVFPYGTEYEFKDLKGTVGHHYSGVGTYGPHWKETPLKGKLGIDAMYYKTDDSPYLLATPCYFKFDTNKLTINYHADGAQSWKTANVNNASEIDVTGKDIMETEALKYDELYSEDAEKQHFCSIARIKRDGYTAKANTWKVGQNGSLEVQDNKILQKAQDVAKYCGVLNEFKKNDTTIDLYPIWTANTYTLTVNPNGGLINGDGSSKVLDTKLCFDTGNCCDINYLKPTRKGFEFLGWYDAPENGNIVYDSNGKCINNGNYWKDSSYVNPNNLTVYAYWKKVPYSIGTVLNIEGSDYIVMSQTDDDKYLVMRKDSIGNKKFQSIHRADGQNQNTYEGSEIDNYLENDWYNSLSSTMKSAIQPTSIKQASYATFGDPDSIQKTGFNGQVYNTIDRHAFLPSVSEIGKAVDLKNPDKLGAFLNGDRFWTRDSFQRFDNSVESLGAHIGGLIYYYVYNTYGVRPAFVIDLSKIDYTVTGTVNYK